MASIGLFVMRVGHTEEALHIVAKELPYQTIPAKTAPMAKTPNGIVMTDGLSCGHGHARDDRHAACPRNVHQPPGIELVMKAAMTSIRKA